MASLLELADIEEDSRDPADTTGAYALRRRIRMLLKRKAFNLLQAIPGEPNNQQEREAIALARTILQNPEPLTEVVVGILLGEAPDAATPAQILGATDSVLSTKTSAQLLAHLSRGLSF